MKTSTKPAFLTTVVAETGEHAVVNSSSNVVWLELGDKALTDDIDSLFAEFSDREEFQQGLIEAGHEIADSVYGDAINIKSLRLRKGMSQTALAEACGMKQPSLARIENAEGDPKLSTMKKLAQALDESIDTIALALSN